MIKILSLWLLFSLAGNLQAQENTFSLQQAIDYALKNHTSVLNAQLDEDIARKKVNEIVGLGTPQIEGYADFIFTDYKPLGSKGKVPEKIQLHILLNKTDTEVMDYQEILVNIKTRSDLHTPATLKFFVASEFTHYRYASEHTVNYIP